MHFIFNLMLWIVGFVVLFFVVAAAAVLYEVIETAISEQKKRFRRYRYGLMTLDNLRAKFATANGDLHKMTVELATKQGASFQGFSEVLREDIGLYYRWVYLAAAIAQRESGFGGETEDEEAKRVFRERVSDWAKPIVEKLKAEAEAVLLAERRKKEEERKTVRRVLQSLSTREITVAANHK